MRRDLLDRIDQLVDESMAGGEPRQGYDYGDPQYPKCWHCQRAWHGLPVTERIAAMYSRGVFDEDYRVDADDSPVLCEGSEFIGPTRGQLVGCQYMGARPSWLDGILSATIDYLGGALGITVTSEPFLDPAIWSTSPGSLSIHPYTTGQRRWWRIETRSRNWHYETIHHSGQIQLQIDRQEVWVGHPQHILMFNDQVDVLASYPPQRGGTWVPLTAPGVVEHPGEVSIGPPTFAPFDAEGNLQLDDGWQVVGRLDQ